VNKQGRGPGTLLNPALQNKQCEHLKKGKEINNNNRTSSYDWNLAQKSQQWMSWHRINYVL